MKKISKNYNRVIKELVKNLTIQPESKNYHCEKCGNWTSRGP